MSNVAYMGQSLDIVLGQDFLTWLWYKSEVKNSFSTKERDSFSVFMEQRIVVQGGEGDLIETASVSGAMSELREARLGLTTGKKVTRALIRFEQDQDTWQLSLKAEDFAFGGLKTPKVENTAEKEDDPEAVFFEKMFLIEKSLSFIDAIFEQFIKIRISQGWREEVKEIQSWMYPDQN